MRVLLADLRGEGGFVSKDTVAGGYGSRLRPFSRVTSVVSLLKQRFHALPSLQMGYAAALAAQAGHEVSFSDGPLGDADVAIVLSSLVDFRRETAWAEAMRRRGARVGIIGMAASKLPHLFEASADFVAIGEPEAALERLFRGEVLTGRVDSPEPADLDALPFPRWDLITESRLRLRVPFAGRPAGGTLPVLASRSCPEFCTYCPHRILSSYRARSTASILNEVAQLAIERPGLHVVFRDPLFTEDRDRVLELAGGIRERRLQLTFECETRLDRLDTDLLAGLHAAGLRAMSFGVEAVGSPTLRKVGRRPIPEIHQRQIVAECRRLGIVTAAFYVFGFPDDDWQSVSATIRYAIDLGSTVAQFKILTPYPGTPLFKRLEPHITESDWERFDGFTPTFTHSTLSQQELTYLLGAAYTRFYMRPSYVANYLRIRAPRIERLVHRLDARVERLHDRREQSEMSRAVSS